MKKKIRFTEKKYYTNNILDMISTYEYDSQGRIVEEIRNEVLSDGSIRPITENFSTYSDINDDNIIYIKNEVKKRRCMNDSFSKTHQRTTYFKNGETDIYNVTDSYGIRITNDGNFHYIVNKSGNIKYNDSVAFNDNGKVLSRYLNNSRIENTYDEYDRLIRQIETTSDGNVIDTINRTFDDYSSNDNYTHEWSDDYKHNMEYIYDDDDNLLFSRGVSNELGLHKLTTASFNKPGTDKIIADMELYQSTDTDEYKFSCVVYNGDDLVFSNDGAYGELEAIFEDDSTGIKYKMFKNSEGDVKIISTQKTVDTENEYCKENYKMIITEKETDVITKRLIRTKTTVYNYNNDIIEEREECEYNTVETRSSQNHIYFEDCIEGEIIQKYVDGKLETVFEYNNNGEPVMIHDIESGDTTEYDSEKDIKFDIAEISDETFRIENGEPYTKCKYDNMNRVIGIYHRDELIKEITYYDDGNIKSVIEYDDSMDAEECEIHMGFDKDKNIISKKYVYFDGFIEYEYGEKLPVVLRDISDNPCENSNVIYSRQKWDGYEDNMHVGITINQDESISIVTNVDRIFVKDSRRETFIDIDEFNKDGYPVYSYSSFNDNEYIITRDDKNRCIKIINKNGNSVGVITNEYIRNDYVITTTEHNDGSVSVLFRSLINKSVIYYDYNADGSIESVVQKLYDGNGILRFSRHKNVRTSFKYVDDIVAYVEKTDDAKCYTVITEYINYGYVTIETYDENVSDKPVMEINSLGYSIITETDGYNNKTIKMDDNDGIVETVEYRHEFKYRELGEMI